jgi:hypothetical protein
LDGTVIRQQGSSNIHTADWRELSDLDYDPIWDNINWTLTVPHTGTEDDLYSPGFDSRFVLTGRAVGVTTFQININSTSTLTNLSVRILENPADLVSESAVNLVTGGGIFGGASAIESEFSVTAEISKTVGYASELNSTTTVTAAPGFIELVSADLTSTSILDADVIAVPPTRGEADLLATFSIEINAASYSDAIILPVGEFALTTDITVIPPIRIEADLASEFALTAVIGSIEQFAVLVASSGTLSATAYRTQPGAANIIVTTSVTTTIIKITGYSADLESNGFQLAIGDVINIDPYYQLTVPGESRYYYVLSEDRIFTVEQETRVNLIKG